MTNPNPDIVRMSTRSDVICAIAENLGFVPKDSVAFLCVHGPRRQFGLTMRYDLADVTDTEAFAVEIGARVDVESADGVFAVVFDEAGRVGPWLPHQALTDALTDELGDLVLEVMLASSDRWWSYQCDDECCGGAAGTPIEWSSMAVTALAAANGLNGHGRLADREAVVRSVALQLDDETADAMCDRIETVLGSHARMSQLARRRAIVALTDRLTGRRRDPREAISDGHVAQFAALSLDVMVRDEVVVRATTPGERERLLHLLGELARRTPPPYDPPVCTMLAWVSYAHGDGVVANVALERALDTDPDYSFARLTADSLWRQMPPYLLERVMREAHDDMVRKDAVDWS